MGGASRSHPRRGRRTRRSTASPRTRRRCSSSTATTTRSCRSSGARRFVAKLRATSQQPVVYAELHGAQHAFEVFPSFRTVRTVEYVERFLHHVHAEYLARSSDPGATQPLPDDVDVAPLHADQVDHASQVNVETADAFND